MVRNALIIPDTHAPYQHPQIREFLEAVKLKYGPFDYYFHLGDETDGHSWSYHEPSTKLANPDLEFERAKRFMKWLYKYTDGKCGVCKSNHGGLAYRKAKTGKIPTQIMHNAYQRALEAPPGWTWFEKIILKTEGGDVMLHHGFSSSVTWNVALKRGISIITGHHHTKFGIRQEFIPSLNRMIFSAQVGTLIDNNSPAFDYNKTTAEVPKLGCLVLRHGVPILVPMIVDKFNKWNGKA